MKRDRRDSPVGTLRWPVRPGRGEPRRTGLAGRPALGGRGWQNGQTSPQRRRALRKEDGDVRLGRGAIARGRTTSHDGAWAWKRAAVPALPLIALYPYAKAASLPKARDLTPYVSNMSSPVRRNRSGIRAMTARTQREGTKENSLHRADTDRAHPCARAMTADCGGSPSAQRGGPPNR